MLGMLPAHCKTNALDFRRAHFSIIENEDVRVLLVVYKSHFV